MPRKKSFRLQKATGSARKRVTASGETKAFLEKKPVYVCVCVCVCGRREEVRVREGGREKSVTASGETEVFLVKVKEPGRSRA